MNTALNRTSLAFLTNKSGGDLAYGDVVVLDNTNANGFTTTTTAGLSTRGLGVIFDVAGIANNATGAVAIGGWCPQVNLNAAATVGQFLKTHTVAGQGMPHSSPQVEGDFGVALSASATPAALLFGSPNAPTSTPGLVLLESHTASASASLDFTTWYSASYDDYLIEIIALVANTNTASIDIRVSTNGGVSYANTGYLTATTATPLAGGGAVGLTATDGIELDNSYGTGVTRDVLSGTVRMFNPGDSTNNKLFTINAVGPSSAGGFWQFAGASAYDSASAIDAFQVIPSSGTLTSGTVRVYGLIQ